MDDFIWVSTWCFFWAHAIDIAQMAGLALAYLIFAGMCCAWAARFYDWIKHECDLERLLDTPQKREAMKMEGITTFEFPEPEDVRKPITEPLKPIEMLEVPTEEEDAAQIATEQELQAIWTALEDKAREYNIKRPYTFSREEVLSLRKVYDKVREQSQKEQKAS